MLKTFLLRTITVVYVNFTITVCIDAQSFEKGGTSIGGNFDISFIDLKTIKEKHNEINTDIDFGYLITNKSWLGFKLRLSLSNEKTNESYGNYNHWKSNCYFKTRIFNKFYIETFSGYGKYHYKHVFQNKVDVLDDINIAQFGLGLGYPYFLFNHVVINPMLSYDHTIMFVKNLEGYSSNQHFNHIIFKVGLYYYFNCLTKINHYENTN
jgi:hypothetical protein